MQATRVAGLSQPLFRETSEQATPLNAVLFRSKQQHAEFKQDKENTPDLHSQAAESFPALSTHPSTVVKKRSKKKQKAAPKTMFVVL